MKKYFLLLIGLYGAFFGQAQSDSCSYRIFENLAYLEADQVEVDSLQRLHLLVPEGIERPPLFIWVGGGAWSFVDRHMELDLARKFAREGFAVAAVGHRLSQGTFRDLGRTSGVKHPAHIEDLAAALRWLYDQAGKYGYDAQNIFVGGFSSGAHLSALLGMDERYLKAQGLSFANLRGLLPIAGTYDIVDYHQVFAKHENPARRPLADTHVKDVFGAGEADFRAASPVTYLDQLTLPMLLVSENGLYNYTQLFEERLLEIDYQNYQILHEFNFDHAGLWRDLSFGENSLTREVMINFMRKHTQKTAEAQAPIDPATFATIDPLIDTLYAVISGPAGERDWLLFQSLFYPHARLGYTWIEEGEEKFRSFDPEFYVVFHRPIFQENAFYEQEIDRKINQYGGVAQVFTSYQFGFKPGEIVQRGINSIQLIRENNRWYITQLFWQAESKELPLPELKQ
ncbi:MAG: alpha/beta hydrolase [Bacteroidota bacterium]